jgi:four helix bundle protein
MSAECGVRNAEFGVRSKERGVPGAGLRERTKSFALQIIKAVEGLPKNRTAEVIGRQLLRCGTSVGANYRASCRAKSQADFIAKMGIVEEEADETIYWMELLIESGVVRSGALTELLNEANQIVAMTVASIRTARRNRA